MMKRFKSMVGVTLGVMLLLGGALIVPKYVNSNSIFTDNVEAISSGESFWNTLLWYKVWTDCRVNRVQQIVVTSGNIGASGDIKNVVDLNYDGCPYASVIKTFTVNEPGRKSYCCDGRQLCMANDCR